MKNFILKESWFSRLIILLFIYNFCLSVFDLYQGIYNSLDEPSLVILHNDCSQSFLILVFYFMICYLFQKIYSLKENEDEIDESYYSDFPPHQQRVFEERDELEVKYIKLSNFVFGNQIFKDLPEIEQLALKDQYANMERYLAVLNQRISRF